jgi:hypothetical protein
MSRAVKPRGPTAAGCRVPPVISHHFGAAAFPLAWDKWEAAPVLFQPFRSPASLPPGERGRLTIRSSTRRRVVPSATAGAPAKPGLCRVEAVN